MFQGCVPNKHNIVLAQVMAKSQYTLIVPTVEIWPAEIYGYSINK